MFYCSSASGLKSQGVGMTDLPLGGNKLEVAIYFIYLFFFQYRESMKNYKILLALQSLYGQFTSNNTLSHWVHAGIQLKRLTSFTCWFCQRNVFRWMPDRPGQLELSTQRGGTTTTENVSRTFSFTFTLSKLLCSTAINGENNSSFYYMSPHSAPKSPGSKPSSLLSVD